MSVTRSVEQSLYFHVIRRAARAAVPGMRLHASPDLEPGDVELNFASGSPMVRLGEGTPQAQAAAACLLMVGHAIIASRGRAREFFGRGVIQWRGREAELTRCMARQGAGVDRDAAEWAKSARAALFPHWDEAEFGAALAQYLLGYDGWLRYFSKE